MTTTRDLQLRHGWRRLGWIAIAGQLALGGALADEAPPDAAPPAPADANDALSGLVYVPHDFAAPAVTESGGVRSATQRGSELPQVFVLAPPQLARVLSPQPTLYWYLSGPSQAPVRLTVQGLEAAEPALEMDLDLVPSAGLYATSLAEHGVRLEAGDLYQWSVALAVNPEAHSEEPVATTIFTMGEADPALLAKIEGAPALMQIEMLAGAGYWYDALDLLSRQIAAGDRSQPWRQLRAALLQQVGLVEPAAFDRAAGPGG